MKTRLPDLSINTTLARQILAGFIHSEVTRTGFTKAVIGLSGVWIRRFPVTCLPRRWDRTTCWPSACLTVLLHKILSTMPSR